MHRPTGDWRSWLARLHDTQEVTGSTPVSPTHGLVGSVVRPVPGGSTRQPAGSLSVHGGQSQDRTVPSAGTLEPGHHVVQFSIRARRWLMGAARGGGGNRTRVLQRFGESSPSAVAGGLSGDCGQRHPASRRSRLCVSPSPRRHGRRASPADDGTDARRTGATGPNSQPEVRLRAPDRLDRRWRLCLFPALFRGSGDHGSLLSLQPSKSKPITPEVVAEATLCGLLRRVTTLAMGCDGPNAVS